MAEFDFSKDPKGGVGMRIVAHDQFDMFNAAVAAMCLFIWNQEQVVERESFPVSWYGFDIPTTVVGLLSEVLFRMETDGWVIKRFVTESLGEVDDLDERHRRKQLKITGMAYGERYDPQRHQKRFPVSAVLLPGLKVKDVEQGVELYCVLDA